MNYLNSQAIAYIDYLKGFNKEELRECDFSKCLALILPQFFPLHSGWFITPEYVLIGNYAPDYIIGKIETALGNYYGTSLHHLLVEAKNHTAVSGWVLMNTQLWNQADAAKNIDGKLFCIGLIGFDICFFVFDIAKYPSASGFYRNFSPLNLNNFSQQDLDYLEIKYLVETTNNIDSIRVIKGRLDLPDHHKYIVEMLNYVSTNTP